jgi:hypothetical protein
MTAPLKIKLYLVQMRSKTTVVCISRNMVCKFKDLCEMDKFVDPSLHVRDAN